MEKALCPAWHYYLFLEQCSSSDHQEHSFAIGFDSDTETEVDEEEKVEMRRKGEEDSLKSLFDGISCPQLLRDQGKTSIVVS